MLFKKIGYWFEDLLWDWSPWHLREIIRETDQHSILAINELVDHGLAQAVKEQHARNSLSLRIEELEKLLCEVSAEKLKLQDRVTDLGNQLTVVTGQYHEGVAHRTKLVRMLNGVKEALASFEPRHDMQAHQKEDPGAVRVAA